MSVAGPNSFLFFYLVLGTETLQGRLGAWPDLAVLIAAVEAQVLEARLDAGQVFDWVQVSHAQVQNQAVGLAFGILGPKA